MFLHREVVASSKRGFICPVCGDPGVTFNSRTMVEMGKELEWVGIFVCPESHTFLVPLSLPTGTRWREEGNAKSREEIRDQTRHRVQSLRQTLQRTRETLRAHRAIRHAVTSTIERIAARRGRPCGLPIQ